MWKSEYKKTFLKELASIPSDYRLKIEELVFKNLHETNPFESGNIEKLKGYKDKYKIRIGNYRIGISISKENSKIIFERVAHRKEIYRLFP